MCDVYCDASVWPFEAFTFLAILQGYGIDQYLGFDAVHSECAVRFMYCVCLKPCFSLFCTPALGNPSCACLLLASETLDEPSVSCDAWQWPTRTYVMEVQCAIPPRAQARPCDAEVLWRLHESGQTQPLFRLDAGYRFQEVRVQGDARYAIACTDVSRSLCLHAPRQLQAVQVHRPVLIRVDVIYPKQS